MLCEELGPPKKQGRVSTSNPSPPTQAWLQVSLTVYVHQCQLSAGFSVFPLNFITFSEGEVLILESDFLLSPRCKNECVFSQNGVYAEMFQKLHLVKVERPCDSRRNVKSLGKEQRLSKGEHRVPIRQCLLTSTGHKIPPRGGDVGENEGRRMTEKLIPRTSLFSWGLLAVGFSL